MAQTSAMKNSFSPPNITPADLEAFHKAHFSTPSLEHFSTHFLGPAPEGKHQEEEGGGGEEEDEDDGLGYYPDGVKRTLTDEQIAMFRHSEIQALLRARRHAQDNSSPCTTPVNDHASTAAEEQEEQEEGELQADQPPTPALAAAPSSRLENMKAATAESGAKPKKVGRSSKRGGSRNPRQPQVPKPDLRKRTWDTVGGGLGSLDYGEATAVGGNAGRLAVAEQGGRRRISYDDV